MPPAVQMGFFLMCGEVITASMMSSTDLDDCSGNSFIFPHSDHNPSARHVETDSRSVDTIIIVSLSPNSEIWLCWPVCVCVCVRVCVCVCVCLCVPAHSSHTVLFLVLLLSDIGRAAWRERVEIS